MTVTTQLEMEYPWRSATWSKQRFLKVVKDPDCITKLGSKLNLEATFTKNDLLSWLVEFCGMMSWFDLVDSWMLVLCSRLCYQFVDAWVRNLTLRSIQAMLGEHFGSSNFGRTLLIFWHFCGNTKIGNQFYAKGQHEICSENTFKISDPCVDGISGIEL